MATKKKTATEKHSKSFDYPAYGQLMPKGTVLKTNRDGTVTPVLPKKKTKKK